MPQWNKKERWRIVELFLKTQSVKTVQRAVAREMKRAPPSPNAIKAMVKKCRDEGGVQNLNKGRSGRKRSVRTAAKKEQVQTAMENSPMRSLRKQHQALNISYGSLWRIARQELKKFPYRIQVKQPLSAQDKARRVNMCDWFHEAMAAEPDFIEHLWFSDESHFSLDGYVNKKNTVFWGSEPPTHVIEKPLHSEKCTVWMAISCQGIIGPFFFEEHGRTTTVNTERYVEVLKKMWTTMERRGIDTSTEWFQQDGAPPHTAVASRQWLEDHFARRLISFRTANEWAPHSPDLSPADFFL